MAQGGKKRTGDLSDWHLWTEVARSVAPLRPEKMQNLRKAAPPAPKPTPAPIKQQIKASIAKNLPAPRGEWTSLAALNPAPKAVTPHKINVVRPKVAEKRINPRMKRKLSKGRLEIDGTLDLHGMRQHEAHGALLHFVTSAYARGLRNLLVITGKGVKRTDFAQFEHKGVLRYRVPEWLEDSQLRNLIAGIEGAGQSHGGEGALYIRLKRNAK